MNNLTGQKKLLHERIGKIFAQLKKDAKKNNQPELDYSREEFTTWLKSQDKFQKVVDLWDEHKNVTDYTPKVSVRNKTQPYLFTNLKLNPPTLNDHGSMSLPKSAVEAEPERTPLATHLTPGEYTELSDVAKYQEEAIMQANITYAAMHRSVVSAAKTGAALAKVKEGLGHGMYLPWIKENMPISERQCQKFIQLAKSRPELLGSKSASASLLDIDTELKLLSMDTDEANEMRESITEQGFNRAESKEFISRVQADLEKEKAVSAQKGISQEEHDTRHKQVIQADVAAALKAKSKALRDKAAKALKAERLAKRDATNATGRVRPLEKIIADRDEKIKEVSEKRNELEKKLKNYGSDNTESLQSKIDELNKKYADLETERDIESKEIDRLNGEIEANANDNSDLALPLLVQAKALIQEALNIGISSDHAKSIRTDILELSGTS